MKTVAIPIMIVSAIVVLIPFTAPGVQKAWVRQLIDSRIAEGQAFSEANLKPWERRPEGNRQPVVKRFRITQDVPVVSVAANAPAPATAAKPKAPAPAVVKGAAPPVKQTLQFSIQVCAGRSHDKALELARKLRAGGSPAYTHRHVQPGNIEWHRVYVGAYSDRRIAARQAVRLRHRFPGAFVARAPLAQTPNPVLEAVANASAPKATPPAFALASHDENNRPLQTDRASAGNTAARKPS
jgi:hypothetical protein